MTANQAVNIVNLVALVGWVLLALSPRLPRVVTTVTGAVIPTFLALVYVVLVSANFGRSEGG